VGFINLSLLLVANLVMRTRYPKTRGMQQISVLTIVNDAPYVGYMIGCFLVRLLCFVLLLFFNWEL
jgi:hypothetical protein